MSSNHGMGHLKGIDAFCNRGYHQQSGDRFGRLLQLPPLFIPADQLRALGASKGPMDSGKKACAKSRTVPVGQIFFGQFVDHDITLDVSTSLTAVVSDATMVDNARTPTLDLDCLYAQGPEASPYLYHAHGEFEGIKLLEGADGTGADQDAKLAQQDLCRTVHGTAIIGDPRNDENRVLSQLQLAMIRFHNKVVDSLSSEHSGKELYEKAHQSVTWHYQWAVIHDFLPSLCGAAVVADVLGNGRRWYCANSNDPYIPVEFSVAAYRFGHSMIPQTIKIQKGKTELDLFGDILGRGFSPLSDKRGVVDWAEVFNTPMKRQVQMAEKLDAKLASSLLALPFIKAPSEASLATRNLLRGQAFLLPSGENVARIMDRPEAEIAQVHEAAQSLAGKKADLSAGTPLWFYLLVEASKVGRESVSGKFDKGEGLGPVGARLVAETLVGLIELDPRSFMAQNRSWSPSEGVGVSTVGEMMTYSTRSPVRHA